MKLPVEAQRGTYTYWDARRVSDTYMSAAACLLLLHLNKRHIQELGYPLTAVQDLWGVEFVSSSGNTKKIKTVSLKGIYLRQAVACCIRQ